MACLELYGLYDESGSGFKILELKAKNKQLEDKICNLQTGKIGLVTECKKLEADLFRCQISLLSCEDALAESKTNTEKLQNEFADYMTDVSNKSAEEIRICNKKITDLRDDNGQLQKQIEGLTTELKLSENAIEENRKIISSMQKTIEYKEKNYNLTNLKVEHLSAELNVMSEKNTVLINRATAAEEKAVSAEEKAIAAEERATALQGMLTEITIKTALDANEWIEERQNLLAQIAQLGDALALGARTARATIGCM